jgi:hypothetical protein
VQGGCPLLAAVFARLNPIEKGWSKLKEIIRRQATLTREAFDRAVAFAMSRISRSDIRAWTAYAGYSLAST